MRDGVTLETELFVPQNGVRAPTILLRVPYGLRGFSTVAEIYAERGFNAVIQAAAAPPNPRGEFDPLVNERNDGLDTLAWIKAQPWFDGRLGLSGPSYLGYAQWAISDALPKQSAMAVKVSSAEFRSVTFPGGSFSLTLMFGWMQVIEGLRRDPLRMASRMGSGGIEKSSLRASMKLPLLDADKRMTGHVIPFWRRWLDNAVANPQFWEPLDHTHRIGMRTPPTSFVSGWYDFMLDQLLRDYETLTDAGQRTRLTIGPWFHVSEELQLESIRDTLVWMNAELLGDLSGLHDKPVRLYIGGRNEWHSFLTYPPAVPRHPDLASPPPTRCCRSGRSRPRNPTATNTTREIRRPASAAPCSPLAAPGRSIRTDLKNGTTF